LPFAGPLIDQSLEHVKQLFDTNTFSVVRICKAVVPFMAKRKSGTIVNIGSIMGNMLVFELCKFILVHELTLARSSPWNGIYCASKAAMNSISEVLYVELKPFGIHVLHVAAGGVKSNIATNGLENFTLPENTLYGQFVHNIIDRVNASQDSASMPNDEFAKKVVAGALKTNPPRYMTLGGHSLLFSIFGWLPRGLVLYILWKRFSGA
jgi:1-acylglycerone phosphate reductase